MNKKIIVEVAVAIAIAAGVVAMPMVAGSAGKNCETSTTVGSGRPLSQCPDSFRTGDRRGVTP